MRPIAPITLGLVVGNRGFFPAHLCDTGRREVLAKLEELGIRVVTLPTDATRFGAVESLSDATKCADLFRGQAGSIDGVLVTLPNFGDERAVANALRWSGLKVPVLVHAFKDGQGAMTIRDRRDSFCGKMSVCNNLRQYGIPFSLTRLHTVNPGEPSFAADLHDFAVTCRVVRALRNLRIGALGARPTAFNTVRYSEKLLEQSGISIETLDLFELFGWIGKMKDDDAAVQSKLTEIHQYVVARSVPSAALLKMAKFGVAVDGWMERTRLDATAIQCWTAMEEFFGVVPCTLMSMMSNLGLSSACEVDIMGTVAMYALAQAGGRPSALVDWNNNYGDDPDKGVIFHCSNLPKDLFVEEGPGAARMDFQEIIAGTVGKENTYGTVVGRLKMAPLTYLRCTTDDTGGRIRAYLGEGELTNDPLDTFGGVGVVKIREFQTLLRYICENGFEHHVAVNPTRTAAGVREALGKYLGWETYHHA
ncbi:MAG: L-fucose/L-arabinose isomerase family protein [Verrucomicrobiales bacterium]|nr:L-fucose/L-arabinose isomerase family protein [Verrucomicrobiales bacterium]